MAQPGGEEQETERGERAGFDRRSGEVHGSGADAGGSGAGKEDYDADPVAGSGKGHPLPDSDEARHNEIPEHVERDKGRGDDERERVQPAGQAVAPDGAPYRYDDLGRGPGDEGDDG